MVQLMDVILFHVARVSSEFFTWYLSIDDTKELRPKLNDKLITTRTP